MFDFAKPAPRRRPSLTPMIDVVFLLLVFFMLAARFGQDTTLPLTTGTGSAAWEGAPRLITLTAEGARLNGAPVDLLDLARAVRSLLPEPGAPVLLQPARGVDLAALTALLDRLAAEGIANVILVEVR